MSVSYSHDFFHIFESLDVHLLRRHGSEGGIVAEEERQQGTQEPEKTGSHRQPALWKHNVTSGCVYTYTHIHAHVYVTYMCVQVYTQHTNIRNMFASVY